MYLLIYLTLILLILRYRNCEENNSTVIECLITESSLQVALKYYKKWEGEMQETSEKYNCVSNCKLYSNMPTNVEATFKIQKIEETNIASDFKLLSHCRSLGKKVKLEKLYPSRKQIHIYDKSETTWHAALKYCRKFGLELGDIKDSKKKQEIKTFLDLEYENSEVILWLGGSNIPGNGASFTWNEKSEIITDLNINKKPNCVALYYNGSSNYKLISQDCKAQFSILCEVPNHCYPMMTQSKQKIIPKTRFVCEKPTCTDFEIRTSQTARSVAPFTYNQPRTGCEKTFLMGKTMKTYKKSRDEGCCVYQMQLWSPTSDNEVNCVAKLYKDYLKQMKKTWIWTSGSGLGNKVDNFMWCDTNVPISDTMTWLNQKAGTIKDNITNCVIAKLDTENVGLSISSCTAVGLFLCQSKHSLTERKVDDEEE